MMKSIGVIVLCLFLAHPAIADTGRPAGKLTFGPDETKRCLRCHGMENFAFRDSATLVLHSFTVNPDSFGSSVHRRLSCRSCHGDITEYPHNFSAARPAVSCGADCHASDSTGRPYLHTDITTGFARSVHGKGLTEKGSDSPSCLSCHGGGNPHAIRKARQTLSPDAKITLCMKCHEDRNRMVRNRVDPDAVASYKRSFHYKAIHFGQTNTAACQDCHTVHNVLPPDSAGSSVTAANLPATCGQRQCHPGAAMNFAMSGANHLSLRIGREPVLKFEETFFIALTAGSMLMLVIGIILDIQKKFGWLSLGVRSVRWSARRLAGAVRLRRPIGQLLRKVLID